MISVGLFKSRSMIVEAERKSMKCLATKEFELIFAFFFVWIVLSC